MARLTPEELAEWVEASCAAQGVPTKVSDPAVIKAFGVLVGAAPGSAHARQRRVDPSPPQSRQTG